MKMMIEVLIGNSAAKGANIAPMRLMNDAMLRLVTAKSVGKYPGLIM